jgi:uncharacterized protein with PQ loop repeat
MAIGTIIFSHSAFVAWMQRIRAPVTYTKYSAVAHMLAALWFFDAYFTTQSPLLLDVIFGVFIITTSVFLIKSASLKVPAKLLLPAVYMFIFGFSCWVFENVMCNFIRVSKDKLIELLSDLPLQALIRGIIHSLELHGLWHLLAGLALYKMTIYQEKVLDDIIVDIEAPASPKGSRKLEKS